MPRSRTARSRTRRAPLRLGRPPALTASEVLSLLLLVLSLALYLAQQAP